MNEHTNELDTLIAGAMTQITEAAAKQDLIAIQRLSRRATELQQLKDQLAAITEQIKRLSTEDADSAAVTTTGRANGVFRKLPVCVTDGDIRQNLLKLTPHVRQGKIQVGEELIIEAYPSGERFRTVVSDRGNKLRARGEIARFYKEAKVQPDDFVVLTEESFGRWSLKKAQAGEYSQYP